MNAIALVKPALIAASVLAGAACATESAHAGEWRLNPRLCPDLREDARDRAVTRSRADLREDARDSRRVVCPTSAWVYVPARGERVARSRVYAGPTTVVVRRGAYYTPKGRTIVVVR